MTGPDASLLEATEGQLHARMVLKAELSTSQPSHAYLFHGPPGSGKGTAARAFAAQLLAVDAEDRDTVAQRVVSGSHPDVTWVKPSGAHVMRVEDIEEPVVAASGHTPFEASRRVFVLEGAETMNDEVANRLLKTLEDPPSFVHLILLTDSVDHVLETIASRCQHVRFDPRSAAQICAALERDGVEPATARTCAKLSLGNQTRARFLASQAGSQLREDAQRLVAAVLSPNGPGSEPWRGLLDRAEQRRLEAEAEVDERARARLELEPKDRERKALERSFEEATRRAGRRARTEILDLGLLLSTLVFRDLVCIAEGALDAILGVDRGGELARAGATCEPGRLREAAQSCENTRQSLELNVGEELALEALSFRLTDVLGRGVETG